MRERSLILFMALLLAACGSDSPAGPNAGGNGNMSARIDGESWSSVMEQVSFSAGAIIVAGADGAGRAIGMGWREEGVGSYTIGPGELANANFTSGAALWNASAQQGSGTVVVTARSPNRVAGTFSFTLEPVPNTDATGTRSVTQGTFDLTF